jgi:hypothetical protein
VAVTTSDDDAAGSGGSPESYRPAVVTLVVGVAFAVLGLWATGAFDRTIAACFGDLPFAMTWAGVVRQLGSSACRVLPLQTTLLRDSIAALLYGGGLAAVCLGGARLYGGAARRACGFGAIAALTAAAADLAENVALLRLVELHGAWSWPRWVSGPAVELFEHVLPFQLLIGDRTPEWPSGLLVAASGAGLLKWAALLPALLVALGAALTAGGRGLIRRVDDRIDKDRPLPLIGPQRARRLVRDRRPSGALPLVPVVRGVPPTTGGGDEKAGWWRNYAVPAGQLGTQGLCLSGGGIRSATFALGATQQLQDAGRMAPLDLIAAVSGGAYHATSRQLLLNRPPSDPPGGAQPITHPYGPGTPEEDHRRRHGRYLADGGGGWMAAVGHVLRNLVLSAVIVGSLLLVVGRVHVGVLTLSVAPWAERLLRCGPLRPSGAADATSGPAICATLDGFPLHVVAVVLLTPLTLAGLVWLVGGFLGKRRSGPAAPGTVATAVEPDAGAVRLGQADTVATGLLAVGGFAVLFLVLGPALIVLSGWLDTQGQTWTPSGGQAAGGVAGLLISLLWSMIGGKRDTGATAGLSTVRTVLANAGFLTRFVLSAAVVGGILVGLTLAYAGLLRAAAEEVLLTGRPLWSDPWLLGPLVVLLLLYGFLDQTRMSLHPFYKRRLAAALAVERTSTASAAEIDYAIPTPLSLFACPVASPGPGRSGPTLLICAAAHVSGPDLAPPGRRVTPFVFSHDAVGGPRLGYLATTDLEERVAGLPYSHDLSTTGAMALSGAAFASAMGRMSGPYNALFALSNARLGAWLPNPRYHALLRQSLIASTSPSSPTTLDRHRRFLPRVRRLPYWLREIVGRYDPDHRLVYVSDGGHYENLGLLELLRRGCRRIWCIDASGDAALGSLVEAIRIAEEEIGVTITFDAGLDPLLPLTDAGSATAQATAADPALLRRLTGRLASTCVGAATIAYPAVGPGPGVSGRLYYGRAGLTGSTPAHLLHYATTSPRFPNDTTGDQWFDVARFEAYRTLGRWVASELDALALADGA